MSDWSKIRGRLENEYLAPSLRGHIRYFVTAYSKCPDHEGRAAILLDGRQVIAGSYCEQWSRAPQLPQDETLALRLQREFPFMDNTALQYGQFDQRCFYEAFRQFDSQRIGQSLTSGNLLVRIFAILDRRVGKRRLESMRAALPQQPAVFQQFYRIRAAAEGLRLP